MPSFSPLPEETAYRELERQLPPPPPRPDDEPTPLGELAMWLRVLLVSAGIVLLAVGVAGLFLPGLQGILTLLLGMAVLSLVSSKAHRLMRWSLEPWPSLLDRVERLRLRTHAWLHRNGCTR